MKASTKKAVLGMTAKIVEKEVQKLRDQWPPTCMGILHQPKRPKKS